MAEEQLTQLTDTIDRLVSEARTTTDRKERTLRLQEALARACEMVTRLNRRLKRVADRVLQESGFGEEHAAITFRDVVDGNDELAHFQSREALLDFLDSSEPLLVGQLFLSKKKIREILSTVRDTYEQFMDQRVGLSQMCEQFDRLERFFCRPPYNGCGGTPVLDGGDPNRGPSDDRAVTVCTYLQTFVTIVYLIVHVFEVFGPVVTGATAQLQSPEEGTVSLLSLLLLSGFSDMLDKQEHIPTEAYAPEADVLQPAGAPTEKQVVRRG